ncbi:hypothetical protein GGD61_001689 [Bradyrhizobium sp. SBR1B]|nr:hypothetical protein [Bradyrhizobium sp. SBR1B]
MSEWLTANLIELGLPAVSLEARQVKAALSAMPVKTDRNDARVGDVPIAVELRRADVAGTNDYAALVTWACAPQQTGGADPTRAATRAPSPPLASPHLEHSVMLPRTEQGSCRIENWTFCRRFAAGYTIKLSAVV